MSAKVVVLTALPAPVRRGAERRADLGYLAYSRPTWEWWCARHGIELLLLDRAPATGLPPTAPATILRWFAAAEILRTRPRGTRLAMVDADAMIRWDAPDFFDCYDGRLGAVRSQNQAWIRESLAAFQPLFPGVVVKPERYFNAGVVLAGKPQLQLLECFGEFCMENLPRLERVFQASNVGTDQTPLNFIIRRERHRVLELPIALNLTFCFGWRDAATRIEFEENPDPDWASFEAKVLAYAKAFAFIEWAYIWHFTNTVASRSRVMAETWRWVQHHYR
jgi:hypothetical protein